MGEVTFYSVALMAVFIAGLVREGIAFDVVETGSSDRPTFVVELKGGY
jgi:hypothetical protein